MQRLWTGLAAIASAIALMGGIAQSQEAAPPAKLPPTAHPMYTVQPYPGTPEDARAAIAAGTVATIPLSTLTFTASKGGNTFSDVIVGQSPKDLSPTTTHVQVWIVPTIVVIGSHTFSPVHTNNCGGSKGHTDLANFLASPILTPTIFDGGTGAGHAPTINGVNMGADTYTDTHRRAEFLQYIGGESSLYHTVFDVTVKNTVTIPATATSGHSAILGGSSCSLLGGLGYNWLDKYIQQTLLPAVGATPQQFVMFLMRDVVYYQGTTSNCCILGYHGATASMQTYSPLDYDTTGQFSGTGNISIAAHEVGEWFDDPLGNNPTPPWGHIGQVSACQNNWEVGDPLSGTLFPAITMPNGVSYTPQETAFWSWYYSKDHDSVLNVAAGGKYSMHGTFAGPARPCPPGGTFPN